MIWTRALWENMRKRAKLVGEGKATQCRTCFACAIENEFARGLENVRATSKATLERDNLPEKLVEAINRL